MRRHLLLGPPGTGKTERLIRVVEQAIARGVPPGAIAYCSFTRAAVNEARRRAIDQFSLMPDALPYFRTLHSLCFRQLGMKRADIFAKKNLGELGDLLGEDLNEHDLDAPATGDTGGALLHLDHFARVTEMSLRDAWHDHGAELDWYRLLRFHEGYRLYRGDHGLVDFTDLLQRYADHGPSLPVTLAIVDEAQDLAPLQWRVALRAFARAEELWLAGDDEQCLYRWSGATVEPLIEFTGAREVLGQSYRLPRRIYEVAREVGDRIQRRVPKTWAPRADDGAVHWGVQPDELDLSAGTWLLLARTKRQLKELRELARRQGVVYTSRGETSIDPEVLTAIRGYETARGGRPIRGDVAVLVAGAMGREITAPEDWLLTRAQLEAPPYGLAFDRIWHDALIGLGLDVREYYLACLRSGEDLLDRPRVRIETIHGAKGLEAEHVLLLTSTTRRIERGLELDPDAEHRVFYVGVTRARQSLWVAPPEGTHGYQI